MKQFILLLSLSFAPINAFSQTNEAVYCGLKKLYIGLMPQLYENKHDTLIKIYNTDQNILQHHFFSRQSFEESTDFDTISIQNPIDGVLNSNDKLISLKKFWSVKLAKPKAVSNEVLYIKNIDFIGDALVDKIEITTSDFEFKGAKPYLLKLYENTGGKYIQYSNCTISLWTKPLKMYVSEVKYLDMAVLMILLESDIPEKSMSLEMVYAIRMAK